MTGVSVAATIDDGHVHVVVEGEVDLSNSAGVEQAVLAAIDNEATAVTIDLTDVGYLDSAGLRIVYTLATRLDLLQIALEVVAPVGSAARHVIELSGLASVVNLAPPAPPHFGA
jgi:anti-anti-sigma factor